MRIATVLATLLVGALTITTSHGAELKKNRPAVSNFSLNTLKGDRFQFNSVRGKVVVISFWASWCKPCIQELGYLKILAKAHPDEMVVLAVSTDAPNTIAGVRKIVKRKRLTMPILLDTDGTVMNEVNPRGTLPFSVYVDRQGNIGATHDGFSSGDEDKLKATVEALLAEPKTAAKPDVPPAVKKPPSAKPKVSGASPVKPNPTKAP